MAATLGEFNHLAAKRHGDPETLTRIAQYEMAFRMQAAVPELADMVLVKNSRLSVQPVTEAEWQVVCRMGGLDG